MLCKIIKELIYNFSNKLKICRINLIKEIDLSNINLLKINKNVNLSRIDLKIRIKKIIN